MNDNEKYPRVIGMEEEVERLKQFIDTKDLTEEEIQEIILVTNELADVLIRDKLAQHRQEKKRDQ